MTIDYVLRQATDADSDALFALHRAALGPYIEAVFGPWDDEVQARFHREWFDAERVQVVEASGALIGVLDCTVTADELRLDRVAIEPAHQNRGIGTAVVTDLLQQADERGLATTLEVFDLNPARHLYERLGFVEVARDGRKVQMRRPAAR